MDNEMHIFIAPGAGSGETGLSAFDAALHEAGIANLNLITLSSVIPPGTTIRSGRGDGPPVMDDAEWGDRLYCVLAQCRVSEPGREAWAGLGWWQADGGRGLFVEEHGGREPELRAQLTASLRGCVERRGSSLDDGHWGLAVHGTVCVDQPVCALVVAVYETEGWGSWGRQHRGARPGSVTGHTCPFM